MCKIKVHVALAVSALLMGWGLARPAETTEASQLVNEKDGVLRLSQTETARRALNHQPGDNQRSTPSASALREVIVTAQKYRQREFDVPISLVVLDSQRLQRREINSIDDLKYAVPGLTIANTGGYQEHVTIRGVSNTLGNGATIGEYIDDAEVTAEGGVAENIGPLGVNTGIYDLERVEVLRGPQGTLFGLGAIGGVMRFITNKPKLDHSQFNADVAATFTQYGEPGQRTDAMINSPLVPDILGLRIVGDFEHDGGWIDEPAANLKNINGGNLADVRIEALWQPTARFKINAMQIIHRHAFGLGFGEDSSGNFTQPFNFALELVPHAQQNSNLSNLTATYDLGKVQLLNSTTYWTYDMNSYNVGVIRYVFGGLRQEAPEYRLPANNFGDEFRVSRIGQGPWQWTAGGYYKDYRDVISLPAVYTGISPAVATKLTLPSLSSKDSSKSWSVYADTNYEMLDRLTLGAGVRYFRDLEHSGNLGQSFGPGETFSSTDPRVYARYQVNSDINIYASAAKGFRSGGFNPAGDPPYGPEEVWSYELGTKMRLLDHRFSFDADIFYSNYEDYVISGFVATEGSFFNISSNAGAARIKGVEGEMAWRPNERWELNVNGAYTSAHFVKINVITGANYHVGEPLDDVVPYSFDTSLERDFRFGGRSEFARLDYSVLGRQRFASYGHNLVGESDVIHMLNAKFGLQWSETLRLGLFAQNLLNDRGYVNAEVPPVETFQARPRPRTLGVEFSVVVE